MLTRRTAIWSGGATLLLAGCGGRPARTIAGDAADLEILSKALQLEQEQVAFYDAGLDLLGGRRARTARAILAHERRHAAAIEEAIRELGGTPQPASTLHGVIPNSTDAWVREAIRAEEGWTAAYAAALPKLANKRLRATFGALMTSEAEHAVALELA